VAQLPVRPRLGSARLGFILSSLHSILPLRGVPFAKVRPDACDESADQIVTYRVQADDCCSNSMRLQRWVDACFVCTRLVAAKQFFARVVSMVSVMDAFEDYALLDRGSKKDTEKYADSLRRSRDYVSAGHGQELHNYLAMDAPGLRDVLWAKYMCLPNKSPATTHGFRLWLDLRARPLLSKPAVLSDIDRATEARQRATSKLARWWPLVQCLSILLWACSTLHWRSLLVGKDGATRRALGCPSEVEVEIKCSFLGFVWS
jgi:hypothetical protein